METTSWASGVNQIITDKTNYSIGEKAVKTESSDNSPVSESVNTCLVAPRKFSVEMSFDFVKPIRNGKTELELFQDWFSFIHRNGAVPFEFPKIGDNTKTALYKIQSAPRFSKSGLCQNASMTWVEIPTEVISVVFPSVSPTAIVAENGNFILSLSGEPLTVPSLSTYTFKIKESEDEEWSTLSVSGIVPKAYKSREYTYYFTEIETEGIYDIKCDGTSVTGRFTVE